MSGTPGSVQQVCAKKIMRIFRSVLSIDKQEKEGQGSVRISIRDPVADGNP